MIAKHIHLNEIGFKSEAVNKVTLFQGESGSMNHIAIPANKQFPWHTSPVSAWLQVITGKVTVNLEGESHTVEPGQLLFLPAGNPHNLVPEEDTIVTVTKFNNA